MPPPPEPHLDPGQIRFYQWSEPPLAVGKYTLRAKQKVQLAADRTGDGPFVTASESPFTVGGPRFSLDPSDIYSVYPPKDQMGDFGQSLPHVVFTRRTLPWERSPIPGSQPEPGKPWMALLMFEAGDDPKDGIPKLTPRCVDNLVQPEKDCTDSLLHPARQDSGEGPTMGPVIDNRFIDDYEKKDACNTIDVPLDIFRRLAPRPADLQFLAHVRQVKTDAKETLSFLADGWFSVILGNRFPKQPPSPAGISGTAPPAAVQNTVFLVSLEGLMAFLQDAANPPPLPANAKVRLAVLA